MSHFDAIFFDIDGTLLISSSLMKAAFLKAFANRGYTIVSDPWEGQGMTDYQIIRMFMSRLDLQGQDEEKLADALCLEIQQLVIETLENNRIGACPGVQNLIEVLKEKKIPFGLLTGNMRNCAGPKLRNAGLDPDDFSYGGFGDHSPNRKETALRAASSADEYYGRTIDRQRMLVIGDTPNDILCARQIGAQVLAVASGDFSMEQLAGENPDYLLPDLQDVSEFFRILGI